MKICAFTKKKKKKRLYLAVILTRFRTINMNTQTHIMKEYPAELTLVFFYTSCVSILAAIAGFFVEPDSSKWRITPSVALASVLCSVKCVLYLMLMLNPLIMVTERDLISTESDGYDVITRRESSGVALTMLSTHGPCI